MISSELAELRESNRDGEASWPADFDLQLNGVRWQIDGKKEFVTTLPSGQELRAGFVMKQDEAGGLYSALVFVLEDTDFGPFINMYDLTAGVIQERLLLLVLMLEPLARKILHQARMADTPAARAKRAPRFALDRRPRMEMSTMGPHARIIFDRNNQA